MQVTDAMVEAAMTSFSKNPLSRESPDAMRAALTAALGAMWRPISEAPKDVPVFVWGNNWTWRHGHVGYLHSDYNGHRDVICRGGMAGAPFRLGGHDAPTHFMLLPSPPAQEE